MNHIAEYMMRRNLTADQLREVARLPISRPQLSNIINNHVLPTPPVLMAICEALYAAPLDLYDQVSIDLMHVQSLWERRHPKSIATRSGNQEARARLTPEDRRKLEYVLEHSGIKNYGEWLRMQIAAEYESLRTEWQQQSCGATRTA